MVGSGEAVWRTRPHARVLGTSSGLDRVLWRSVAVLRVASLAYAGLLAALHRTHYAHPWWALAALLVMTAWTAVAVWAYASPGRRAWPLLGADLMLGCGAVLATLAVETPERIAAGVPTLPVSWAAVPVVAWAVWRGPWLGLAAAGCVAVADVAERGAMTERTFSSIVLLLLAGAVIGQLVVLAREAEQRLARAVALEAATEERERLAREVHDGVLQVLALVARRGTSAGGEAEALGRLAGEQEVALRALISTAPVPVLAGSGEADLRGLLSSYASPVVTVTGPAAPVLMPEHVAVELAAAVGAALDNVRRHAGPGARAWVLVEDLGAEVVVSVRDDGVGLPPGRLEAAEAEGRLGVSASIRGRLRAVGGDATITSTVGQGTEVELRGPRG